MVTVYSIKKHAWHARHTVPLRPWKNGLSLSDFSDSEFFSISILYAQGEHFFLVRNAKIRSIPFSMNFYHEAIFIRITSRLYVHEI